MTEIPPRFVQICDSQGYLTALDEKGRVWRYRPEKRMSKEKVREPYWYLLPDTRSRTACKGEDL